MRSLLTWYCYVGIAADGDCGIVGCLACLWMLGGRLAMLYLSEKDGRALWWELGCLLCGLLPVSQGSKRCQF